MRLTPAAREEPDALAQLAQLGAGFGYFPGFCLGRLESDQMVRRREAGISACSANLATFRRKIGALGRVVKGAQQRKTRRERPAGGFTEPDGEGGRIYRVARFSIARPMLMRLSAMTPRPTQRFIPASPL